MSYTVDGSLCVLHLTHLKLFNMLLFELRDGMCPGGGIRLWIQKAENNDLLEVANLDHFGRFPDMTSVKFTETFNPFGGGATKTSVVFYASGSKRGLLVVEQKKKNRGMKPYKGTVAH